MNTSRRAVRIRVRVPTEESAFVYFTLEAAEGVTAYSTLDFVPGCLYRDLELIYAEDRQKDVEILLDSLKDCLHLLPERD